MRLQTEAVVLLPDPKLLSAFLLFIAALLSFYFFGVYARLFAYDRFYVPSFCRLSSDECTSIVDTKYGRVFGVSNAFVGAIFLLVHSIVLIFNYFEIISSFYPFFMSVASTSIGVYLVYGLVKLKVKCNICITVHIINISVFIMQSANIAL